MPIHVRLEFTNGKPRAFLDEALIVGEWVVPKGFETDFASVPKVFWNILPPIGLYAQAAIIHDYLYRTGAVPRAEADEIFRKIMKQDGVSFIVRNIMYAAVRIFGGSHYTKCQCKI